MTVLSIPTYLRARLQSAKTITELQAIARQVSMSGVVQNNKRSLDRGVSLKTSRVRLLEHIVDPHGTGSDALRRIETQHEVEAALERLDPIDREVLAMRHFEMLTNQEVAGILNISVTASSNRYIRALRRLKSCLPDSMR